MCNSTSEFASIEAPGMTTTRTMKVTEDAMKLTNEQLDFFEREGWLDRKSVV